MRRAQMRHLQLLEGLEHTNRLLQTTAALPPSTALSPSATRKRPSAGAQSSWTACTARRMQLFVKFTLLLRMTLSPSHASLQVLLAAQVAAMLQLQRAKGLHCHSRQAAQ